MNCESELPGPRRLLAIVIVLTLVSSGCGMNMKHGRHRGKASYGMTYGVEDCMCHGYQKTCWRSWNETAWASSACPVSIELPAAPKIPAQENPAPMIPQPVIPNFPTTFLETAFPGDGE